MVYADWTPVGASTWALDAVTKRTGSSSVKSTNASIQNELGHNTFSETRAYVVFWAYGAGAGQKFGARHANYGTMETTIITTSTWIKYEIWFWYDAGSNTKWGRIKKNGVQIGSDTNFGAGAPAAGAIRLTGYLADNYIDDCEVWA